MNSAWFKRIIRASLLDPYLIGTSFAFSAVLFFVNQQANLYDIQNPNWVITMGVLILASPIAHSLFLVRARAVLGHGTGSLRDGIEAGATFYPRLVLGEIGVSLAAAAGLFLLILPGVYIGIRLSLYKQAVLFEGKTVREALQESMVRTASWPVIGWILLVLSVIYGMEILIGYLVYLAGASFPTGVGIAIAIVISAAGFSLLNAFLTAVYLERGEG